MFQRKKRGEETGWGVGGWGWGWGERLSSVK